jgi:hypothetical protein
MAISRFTWSPDVPQMLCYILPFDMQTEIRTATLISYHMIIYCCCHFYHHHVSVVNTSNSNSNNNNNNNNNNINWSISGPSIKIQFWYNEFQIRISKKTLEETRMILTIYKRIHRKLTHIGCMLRGKKDGEACVRAGFRVGNGGPFPFPCVVWCFRLGCGVVW